MKKPVPMEAENNNRRKEKMTNRERFIRTLKCEKI